VYQKIIYSFADQISQNSGFTEKQAALAVKILKRHKKQLDNELKLYTFCPFLAKTSDIPSTIQVE
jgi:hypothetical protein